jgi:NAD(P)-dependent dehydrogenase (short-subunit alcohol dehydrogenase family)
MALAQGCADVILAGRNDARGRAAAGKIRSLAPRALIRFEKLDLADLSSIRAFAARVSANGRPIDLLINNAGVMAPPQRQLTADGFELQIGTNYLGHFALTGLLLPQLRLGRHPRVVQVSSRFHRCGNIYFDDLNAERAYKPWAAYTQSKLAALLFAGELQLRSDRLGWRLLSSAAHPGFARTNLFANGRGRRSVSTLVRTILGTVFSQSAADGARSTLFAAASPDVRRGGFYGPCGLFEFAGPPAAAHVSRKAQDRKVAAKLWQVSEELTGVQWPQN